MRNLEIKKDIRARIRKRRMVLLPEQRQAYSKRIVDQVVCHPLFLRAEEIYCYASFGDEVVTYDLIKTAWKMGKKVAVPRVIVDNFMKFYYIDSLKELKTGHYGIPEPEENIAREAEGREVLVILPGVAFDKNGNRIGYGKGFYDAYLGGHPQFHRIGLAFSAQCVEWIPSDSHDIRVEAVITEKGNYVSC